MVFKFMFEKVGFSYGQVTCRFISSRSNQISIVDLCRSGGTLLHKTSCLEIIQASKKKQNNHPENNLPMVPLWSCGPMSVFVACALFCDAEELPCFSRFKCRNSRKAFAACKGSQAVHKGSQGQGQYIRRTKVFCQTGPSGAMCVVILGPI